MVAPQNITGYSVLPYMKEMGEAAGSKPIVLINPRLGDIPSANNGEFRVRQQRRRIILCARACAAIFFPYCVLCE